MSNIVLLGGNGYIGRNVTKKWLKEDPEANIYVISRTGTNKIKDNRVFNLAANVASYDEVSKVLPDQVDYIVDFVGRPEKDDKAFEEVNDRPAMVMAKIAGEKQVKAMGFIGGLLGPKKFTEGKKRIAGELRATGIKLCVVEPTVVYGNGRSDNLAKMIPLFKFFGIFIRNMKPVLVDDVADELIFKMIK